MLFVVQIITHINLTVRIIPTSLKKTNHLRKPAKIQVSKNGVLNDQMKYIYIYILTFKQIMVS